jgi:hypothetical protein
MFPALGPDAETPSTTTGAPRHLRTWSARGYRGRREETLVIVAIRAVVFDVGGVLEITPTWAPSGDGRPGYRPLGGTAIRTTPVLRP